MTATRNTVLLLSLAALAILALAGFGAPEDPARAVRLNNLGVAYMNQQRPSQALEKFRAAVWSHPAMAEARLNIGIALFNAQKFEEAEAAFQAIVERDSESLRGWYNLGLIYKTTGDNERALEAFEHAARLDPEDADTQYFTGLMLFQSGRYQEALAAYGRALKLNRFHVSAEFGTARAWQRLRKTDEARTHLLRFQELNRKKLGAPISLVYGEQGLLSLAVQVRPQPSSAPPPIPVKFTDVTEEAGLLFQDAGGPSAIEPGKNWAGPGACFFDYNNDTDPDLFLINSNGPSALYRNKGDGRFEDVTEASGLSVNGFGLSCTAGDFDNDGWMDLAFSLIDRVSLLRNIDGQEFIPVPQSLLGEQSVSSDTLPIGLTFLDYDHDGDLDLYVIYLSLSREIGQGAKDSPITHNRLWRNNRDGSFTNWTDEVSLTGTGRSSAAVATDFNNDRAVDLLFPGILGSGALYLNPREGRFHRLSPLGIEEHIDTVGVTSLDFDRDGWMDISFTHSGETCVSLWRNLEGKRLERIVLPSIECVRSWGLAVIDYDNDGWLDIAVAGESSDGGNIRLLRNLGAGKFEDITEAVGLNSLKLTNPRSVITADYDRDGDVDILVTQNGGPPVLLRNDGGNANNSVRINLAGLSDNRSAIGAKVEVFAGEMWQKFEVQAGSGSLGQSSLEIVAGIGKETQADIVRILWPTGVLQDEINLAAGEVHQITEVDRRGSSCPLLFAWNGREFALTGDAIGPGLIGHRVAPGIYNGTDPTEYIKLDAGELEPRDGRLSLRFAEPLEEIAFLDRTRLLAVDHPADTEIYPHEYFILMSPPATGEILVSRGARPPVSATGNHGQDVLPALLERDGNYLDDFERLPYPGFAETHTLELELPEWDAAKPLRLLLTGFIDYFNGRTIFAAEQAGVHMVVPRIEAFIAGEWKTIVPETGFPAGTTRTMVTDLTGKLPLGARRLRLVTNFRIYWDRVQVDNSDPALPHRVTEAPLAEATLGFLGFPAFQRLAGPQSDWNINFDYNRASRTGPYGTFEGQFTRYGDVRPLLTRTDDMFVILGPGDETALEFDATALPELPEGWRRTYVFFGEGYVKDQNFYAAHGMTVGPLPFHAMSGYPYPETESYPLDAEHLEYLLEYNTRTISGRANLSYRYDYPPAK